MFAAASRLDNDDDDPEGWNHVACYKDSVFIVKDICVGRNFLYYLVYLMQKNVFCKE
jgi:hypothetical protein